MRVTALVDFHDNAKDVDRKRGEEFVVSSERFAEINRTGVEKHGFEFVREIPCEPSNGKQTPEERAAKAPAKRRAQKASK